ncbi:MAG: bifunctional hydroxymethylpyrimidine kinase/phosphomethylpyrimidine kinase [Corynebacterium sp.]|uniref:bifunctional hydroxymethylpyrimidine kinase/phosphomethylpyrimidine kinase n=1 Tax=Corynebacterium sp. TaxID=1720 RepID=UPI0026DC96C8|nr:bifunctional hydroxymethylpyrimidine kinase/phosphomethylpyrimidine kinase [Corynebacterium sp.]MDO5098237.1 bifunctional hydroxymethylpyrimidine kinase/phosphomethylpyrimidine kinase [Corynebacterium sp.]
MPVDPTAGLPLRQRPDSPSRPRVLSIAGTDPTGGAGTQADMKAIAAAGGFGYSVITGLLAQNSQGVYASHIPPRDFLVAQLTAVSSDVEIDAIKIGMLGNSEIIGTVVSWLAELQAHRSRPYSLPVVIDPVIFTSTGARLLDKPAEDTLSTILDCATVITPNTPELAWLVGTAPADSFQTAIIQATELAQRYDCYVIVKSGHLRCSEPHNAAVSPAGEVTVVPAARISTSNTHGTGCALSASLATCIGAGISVAESLRLCTDWITEAIAAADLLDIGKGAGPIDHFAHIDRLITETTTS